MQITPHIFSVSDVDILFQEINSRNSDMIMIADIESYILNMAAKELKDLQNDVLDEMISKSHGRNIVIDNIFSKDDPIRKGVMQMNTFATVLFRELATNKINA